MSTDNHAMDPASSNEKKPPSNNESVFDATQILVTSGPKPTADTPEEEDQSFLPWDFVPGKRDVICGKAAKHHRGNEWCRGLAAAEMKIYQEEKASGVLKSDEQKRDKKHDIVLRVVDKVKKEGGFVRMASEQGIWARVSQEQAQNKVLEIMQDIVQAKRYQNSRSISSCTSRSRATSATSLLNQSFLEEYVSKQAAVFERSTASLYTPTAGSFIDSRRRKRRRVSTETSASTIPNTSGNTEEQLPQEDLQLQSFLGNMAASMPDDNAGQEGGNPFEPDPIHVSLEQSRDAASAQADSAVEAAPEAAAEGNPTASRSEDPP